MRNRIPFLQRVMDEVHRQAPPSNVPPGDALEGVEDDWGACPESAATPGHPLQMFVEVETLRTVVADGLEALRWSESKVCTNPSRRAAWERAVDQRRQFLTWLGTIGRRRVFLAMYPEYMLESDGDDDGGTKAGAL